MDAPGMDAPGYVVLYGSEREQYLRLQSSSAPIQFQHFHENDKRSAGSNCPPPINLDLFQSHIVNPAQPQPCSYPPGNDKPPPLASILFVGGSVWAMDILPSTQGGHSAGRPPALLALAAHSRGSEETLAGARVGGHCAVQVPLPTAPRRTRSLSPTRNAPGPGARPAGR